MDIFEKITIKGKDDVLKALEAMTLTYKKNNTILDKIKGTNIIGIIMEGSINITKTDYNGNMTIIEKLEEKDIFGTIFSNISNDEYQIIAKEDCKIIIIDYKNILNFQESNFKPYNTFIQNLLKIISKKIKDKNDRIEILTEKSIRNKLLKYFQIESKRHGSKNIYLPFTLTELAEYLAIDRCAMQRELKNLKEDRIIDMDNKKIRINTF